MQVPQVRFSKRAGNEPRSARTKQSAHVKVLEDCASYYKAQLQKEPEAIAYLLSLAG